VLEWIESFLCECCNVRARGVGVGFVFVMGVKRQSQLSGISSFGEIGEGA